MPLSRRKFLKTGAAVAAGLTLPWTTPRADSASNDAVNGPFAPTWDSLSHYACPEWFRDAKFGIWAHWTAQCVPEQGDWYARQMYMQGNGDYDYQCAHYGHPSKVGFKDIDHLWHAENWDPEALISLYKAAGAKYFVALAQHHDNFDCFDSRYQPWNSVAIGPKKDIVGTWAKAARKAGLRFGVTSHGSHAWSWYEVAQGADKTGPLTGVPYDGHLTKADGKGQWWEGLDPQDLYAQDHAPMGLEWDWTNKGVGDLPSKAYCEKFYNRITDVIDKYHPDLIYFDDTVLPLYPISDVGLRLAAYHYNASIKRHGGKLEAVLNGKQLNESQIQCMVHDFERGKSDKIVPHPWQTDTCIGQWHYSRSVYENHQYKTPDQVVKMLVDIVSKNGNLLLNIPVRGDGTIDDDEVKFLQGMAAWIEINGEAIFATRPWTISGEGPAKPKGGMFSEGGEDRMTAQDFRFTTKGKVLYATALGWPEMGALTVKTLAADAPGIVGTVKRVSLLGSSEKLRWERTADGLVVTLPAQKPCDHAYVLKIEGLDVAASQPMPPPPPVIQPYADGSVTLNAADATLHGSVQFQASPEANIGYWNDPQSTVSWTAQFRAPGLYVATLRVATNEGATTAQISVDGAPGIDVSVPMTGDWNAFQTVTVSPIKILSAGDHTITVHPADAATWHAMNLGTITLVKPNE